MMMNMGDVKGAIVDDVLKTHKPKVSVEFGSYIGYSTTRFAGILSSLSPVTSAIPDEKADSDKRIMYSIEPDSLGHACTTAFLHRANLLDKEKVKLVY
eukprot:Awhi_evm1s2076